MSPAPASRVHYLEALVLEGLVQTLVQIPREPTLTGELRVHLLTERHGGRQKLSKIYTSSKCCKL